MRCHGNEVTYTHACRFVKQHTQQRAGYCVHFMLAMLVVGLYNVYEPSTSSVIRWFYISLQHSCFGFAACVDAIDENSAICAISMCGIVSQCILTSYSDSFIIFGCHKNMKYDTASGAYRIMVSYMECDVCRSQRILGFFFVSCGDATHTINMLF